MGKRKWCSKCVIALAILLVATGVRGESKEIDDYIHGLSYSRDEVLAYPGERVTGSPREGKVDDKKTFIVIERNKHTLTNAKTDVGVVASNEHQAYPGNLLLANQRLVDNTPDVLAIDRAPLTYTVNLPGLTADGSFKITPTFSEYQSNINKALNTWFDKYSKDHNVVANFQSDHSFAYSKESLRVKFGLEFKNSDVESNIDFNMMNKQEKLIMIHKFKQIFYTVSVEPTKKASDLFDPKVTLKEIQQKTDNKNPPVLVDSVSYGRVVYVKIETSSVDQEAKAILSNKITKFDISQENEVEYTKKLKNLAMTVYVIGGSSEQIKVITATKFKEVNDVIVNYGKFSKTNLGYPVSYSTQFIKDNSRATVNCYTEYIETTRTEYPKGLITITHKGWFVMQWEVTWKEISYDKNGTKLMTEKSWGKNWHDLTAPFSESIELPGNTVDIRVFAREATGLVWEPWRTVIDRSGIPLIGKREFTVWGTTLSPQHSIEPEIATFFKTSSHFF